MQIRHSHVILDACCVLNFCASGRFMTILKSIPAQVVVTEVVREKELLTLQRFKNENDQGVIQFEAAITQGLLLVVDFDSEAEEETFVNYAFELGDDGDSATCAIAIHRGWAIGTDDKKAISFCQKEAPNLQILSTLEMIKNWAEEANIAAPELRTALGAIRTKGRYIPHRNHPLLSWWENLME
ncbi:MAG TPA: hypothetical protein DDZ80_15675 [Cyanobacteria bacterium UBA8803]|nr:hypothetical protein [Cyanobacteria bacterium UBA9273]HBL59856.1 hypothetical protein [Cyanobacteria bacterium UBA8803]